GLGDGAHIVLGKGAPTFESIVLFVVQSAPTADAAGADPNKDELEKYMNTQAEVMTSDAILRDAIDTNEVRNDTDWIKQFVDGSGGIDVKSALIDLRGRVDARVANDTTLIRLSVSAPNPSDAAVIARAIQSEYVEDNRRVNGGEVTARLQDVLLRITETQAALESIEQSIQARTRSESIESFDERATAAAAEINQLQPTLVDTRTALANARETLDQRERLLGGSDVVLNPDSTPVGFVFPETTRAEAQLSPIVQNFDIQIAGLEANLQTLLRTYGERNASIVRIQDQLRGLRDQRNEEMQRIMMDRFNADLESLRNAIPTLERTERELSEDLEDARRRQNEAAIILQEIESLELQQQRFTGILDRLDRDRTDLEIIQPRAARVRVLQSATSPDSRAFPKPIPIVGASVVVLTGFVVALILLKELREQRVRTPQDVASIPRTRVLGVLPDESMDPARPDRLDRACLDAPEGAIAESIRQIRSSLLQRMDERGHVSVLVGAGLPGSGSTTVVANLAQSIASTGRRVLVIDANLRRPTMHDVFDLPEAPGLAEVLRDRATLDSAVTSGALGVQEISVLTAGAVRKQAYERFLSTNMEKLLEEAREKYDAVLIDVAPGVVSSDMNALGSYVDAAFLVVRAYAEKKGLVARLRNQLAVTGAEFLGVVVNGVKPAAGGYMKRNFAQTMSYHQPK
ncbi:MAG: polysaccharide biosynthesis tyrosine autokinase, partial [Planctomycetota bacterium]